MADYSETYNNKTFPGHSGTSMVVGYNLDEESRDNSARAKEQFLFVEVDDRGSSNFALLSRGEAHRLRNHLTELLGLTEKPMTVKEQPEPEQVAAGPVFSDRTVAAMEELAFRLDMWSPDDLVDALNRHADALENFNK